MADIKTKPTVANVAGFIAAVADDTRRADAKKLAALMQRASGEKPKMWGPAIIGFGSYHYVYDSGREGDMPLVGFSPRKAATVLYVHKDFRNAPALLGRLGKHTTSKACLYIKKLADVDLKALEDLVAESVAAMRVKYKVRELYWFALSGNMIGTRFWPEDGGENVVLRAALAGSPVSVAVTL